MMNNNQRILALFASIAMWLVSAPANAVVMFSDNFDADVTGLNAPGGLINWTIDNGTVDVIHSGSYSIDCVGGTGKCIDMDGSTGNGGRIISKQTFTLLPGQTWSLNGLISGNQRGTVTGDTWIAGFVDAATLAFVASASGTVASSDPYTSHGLTLSFGSPTTLRAFFEDPGIDNIGFILDDVTLECRGTACAAASVPEPGMLALLGGGLMGLALNRRRRRR